jgi:hypothetical protein
MPATSEQLWDAIYHLGAEDLTAGNIPRAVIAKLIEFKMVELSATGLPQLTPYGEKCHIVMESGDGVVPELNDMAAMEDQQRQRQPPPLVAGFFMRGRMGGSPIAISDREGKTA